MSYLINDDRCRNRLYADFQQYYGIDLFSFFYDDEIDITRLCCLISQLPRNSRTVVDGGLTGDQHLLVDILDSLNRIQWELVYVVAGSGIPPSKMRKAPPPIKRPLTDHEKASTSDAPKFVSGAQLYKMFNIQKQQKSLDRYRRRR